MARNQMLGHMCRLDLSAIVEIVAWPFPLAQN